MKAICFFSLGLPVEDVLLLMSGRLASNGWKQAFQSLETRLPMVGSIAPDSLLHHIVEPAGKANESGVPVDGDLIAGIGAFVVKV